MTPGETTRPRRILYVVNEDFAFLLTRLPMARAARDAGFEVHVATNVNGGAAAIEAEGFILHRIPFQRGGLSPLKAIPAVKAIRRAEREIKPSIVHHSGLQCCVFGSVAALGQKFPMVNAITGLGYIFTSASWRSRLLKQGMAWLLPWLLNRKSSNVLVQNPDDREALLALGIKPDRMTLIPGSGVDANRLQPLPEPAGPITIGFAGRLLVDKGIRALVAAHDLLRKQGHEFNLIIAGNPDPANPASVSREEVEEWTRRPGIAWLGHIDNIVSLWRASHIAVLPSHREGLPGSLMEAAACGRPLVATDVPGCREIAIPDQTGLLVPVEDPPALANAILRLGLSAELRARYGAAARKLVEDRLSARIIGKSIVELYNKLTLKPSPETGPSSPRGKILVVSQYYLPFPSTTSRYMTEIADELARTSKVMVISGAPGSASKCPPPPGKPEVVEIKSWWPGKGALVSRFLADMLFLIQAFLAVLKHAGPEDVVLTVTAPFTLPYAVALAARRRKAASTLIMHDLYPDTLVMARLLRPTSLLTRGLRSVNEAMFAWLDAIIIIGRDMAPKLLAYPEVSAAKLSLIPNWATMPIGYREPTRDNPFRERCGGRFIVAMSGNAGYTHDPVSVLQAARLLSHRDDIKFLLSGHGVGWTRLKKMQAASPLPNVTLVERVSDPELEAFLAAANVWIIPYRKNNAGVSVPSRIYNIFAVGRPVIVCSEKDAEAAILLQEDDIGWVTPPEDAKALADAIVLAASDPAQTTQKGRHAASVAARYTARISLGAYRDLMERLLRRQRARSLESPEQVALRPPRH